MLFGYGFDLNSTAIRKKPMGALEAFQLAFPLPELPACFGRGMAEALQLGEQDLPLALR
ncbi:MAG: hypothetical protein R6W06_06855 [Prochlorococcaceae cyanobacterium]